jgi:hypothetical protein
MPAKQGFPLNIWRYRCNLGHGMDVPLIEVLLGTSRTFLRVHKVVIWTSPSNMDEVVSITSLVFGFLKLPLYPSAKRAPISHTNSVQGILHVNLNLKIIHNFYLLHLFHLSPSLYLFWEIFKKYHVWTYLRKLQISP